MISLKTIATQCLMENSSYVNLQVVNESTRIWLLDAILKYTVNYPIVTVAYNEFITLLYIKYNFPSNLTSYGPTYSIRSIKMYETVNNILQRKQIRLPTSVFDRIGIRRVEITVDCAKLGTHVIYDGKTILFKPCSRETPYYLQFYATKRMRDLLDELRIFSGAKHRLFIRGLKPHNIALIKPPNVTLVDKCVRCLMYNPVYVNLGVPEEVRGKITNSLAYNQKFPGKPIIFAETRKLIALLMSWYPETISVGLGEKTFVRSDNILCIIHCKIRADSGVNTVPLYDNMKADAFTANEIISLQGLITNKTGLLVNTHEQTIEVIKYPLEPQSEYVTCLHTGKLTALYADEFAHSLVKKYQKYVEMGYPRVFSRVIDVKNEHLGEYNLPN